MQGASTSGLNCCSRDRKGKQRGELERMTSENGVVAHIKVNLFKFKLWKCLQVVSSFEATNGNRHFWDE